MILYIPLRFIYGTLKVSSHGTKPTTRIACVRFHGCGLRWRLRPGAAEMMSVQVQLPRALKCHHIHQSPDFPKRTIQWQQEEPMVPRTGWCPQKKHNISGTQSTQDTQETQDRQDMTDRPDKTHKTHRTHRTWHKGHRQHRQTDTQTYTIHTGDTQAHRTHTSRLASRQD